MDPQVTQIRRGWCSYNALEFYSLS